MSEADRGRFVWFDLMTTDKNAAIDFYKEVIGWGTQDWEGGEMPYTMWTSGANPLGGVMAMQQEVSEGGAPPHWLGYVCVPDVDATAAQAEDGGGTILYSPTDIPQVGRFAVISDPQGAAIAIFTPAEDAPGHGGPAQPGEFSWHELVTTDHEAAFDFYSSLFGWVKTDAMDMGEMGIYQMYGRAEVPIPLGGMYDKTAEMPGPPSWLYYVRVDDVQRAAERVKELGGQILSGPMEVPGGDWIAQCLDPQGAAFAIHHTAPAGDGNES